MTGTIVPSKKPQLEKVAEFRNHPLNHIHTEKVYGHLLNDEVTANDQPETTATTRLFGTFVGSSRTAWVFTTNTDTSNTTRNTQHPEQTLSSKTAGSSGQNDALKE